MGPATATTRSMSNTNGKLIAPTVFPYGPQWEGKLTPYTPAYNTPHSPGGQPPPLSLGTLRRSTIFDTEPAKSPSDPFGTFITVTFELRMHASRNQRSGQEVSVTVGNSLPLGRVIDKAMTKAYEQGILSGHSHRILTVCGPSGKPLNTGSGLTLYDQSPAVPTGSRIVLVFKD